jgi:transposase-like protein
MSAALESTTLSKRWRTLEERAAAVEAVRNGERPARVARRMGVTPSAVARWLRVAGIAPLPAGRPPEMTERTAEWVRAVDAGESYTEVAQRTGVNRSTVYRAVYRHTMREAGHAG